MRIDRGMSSSRIVDDMTGDVEESPGSAANHEEMSMSAVDFGCNFVAEVCTLWINFLGTGSLPWIDSLKEFVYHLAPVIR